MLAAERPTAASIGDSTTYRRGNDAQPPSRQQDTTDLFVQDGVAASAESYSWDGVGGRPMVGRDSTGRTVADDITRARTRLGKVNRWIIGLGTNDTGKTDSVFSSGVTSILNRIFASSANDDERVWWVNLAYFNGANANATRCNRLLKAAIAAHPKAARVTYLDWNTASHAAGFYQRVDWNGSSDGAHMSASGWRKRDAWIAQQVASGS